MVASSYSNYQSRMIKEFGDLVGSQDERLFKVFNIELDYYSNYSIIATFQV